MLAIAGGIIIAVVILRVWPLLVAVPFLAFVVWFTIANPLILGLIAVAVIGERAFARLSPGTRANLTRQRGIFAHHPSSD